MDKKSFSIVPWKKIKNDVFKLNVSLSDIIDDPFFDNRRCVVAEYSYGDFIVENGSLYFPNNSTTEIKQALSYDLIPLSIVLNKSSEVFVDNEIAIPLNVIHAGEIFGVFEMIANSVSTEKQPKSSWNVVAGARSSFMLPKISDTVGHQRICKKYNIDITPPKDMTQHFEVFKEISKFEPDEQWTCKVLFFTEDWLTKDSDHILDSKFYKFLVKIYWDQMQLYRDMIDFRLVWQDFSREISRRNIKTNHYIIDTVRHLISVANGGFLCFKPAIDDCYLPLNFLQETYTDIYQLNSYFPTIMVPARLKKNESGYYSLSYPVLLDSFPSGKIRSIIAEERQLKTLLDIFEKIVSNKNKEINFKYSFYHSSQDQYRAIELSENIINIDNSFLKQDKSTSKNSFCANSTFFSGCIRIERF